MNITQAAVRRSIETALLVSARLRQSKRVRQDRENMVDPLIAEKDAQTSWSVYFHVDVLKLSSAPIHNVLAEPGESPAELQEIPNLPAGMDSVGTKGRDIRFPSDAVERMRALFFLLLEGKYPTKNLKLPPRIHP